MRIAVALVVALASGGCGASKERAYCERLITLCADEETTATSVAECSTEHTELKALMDAEAYDRFLGCGIAAGSCMEMVGCMSGAVVNLGEQALGDLQRGFDKMRPPNETPPKTRGPATARPGKPLPPECQRFDVVCNEDKSLVRDACIDMVGDLKADPENRDKLVRCYEASKNCITFDKCTSDLWFSLQ